MSEIKEIPGLRFSSFNDVWKLYGINDLVKDEKGSIKIGPFGSQLKRDSFVTDGFKVFGQENIFINDFDFGDRFISESHFERLKTNEILKGDFVISTMGTIGKCSIVPELIKRGIMDSHMIRLRLNSHINSDFLIHLFRLQKTLKQIKRLSVGGIMDGLSIGIIKELKFFLPSIPEQQKIADFLSAVDKRIELLEKKKTLLETYKKGVMKKIFNQNIRFKDDNGNDFPDWEEKRLGEVCKLQGGYAFKSNSFKDEGIPIIRISNISNDNNYLNLENLVHYDEISNDENFTILKGDLLIAMSGATTGKTSISNYDGKCYLNQRVGLFKSKTDKLNYSYLVQFVYSPVFGSQLIQFLVAGAQPNISSKDIESVTIPFPSIVEQQKISQFLSSIDTKLKLIESQIDKSKTWKKGLLQKMFV